MSADGVRRRLSFLGGGKKEATVKDLGKVVDAGPFPEIGSKWRHRKGSMYEVVTNARIEATLEAAVVYRDDVTGMTWVRPLAEFIDGRFQQLPGLPD